MDLQGGHLDTGLTGTYFMMKLLTQTGRNDLVFTMANQTTYPSYGYFLEQGYTTWPERWEAKKGVSKIHGCYNGIGLWFLQGIAGITVDAANKEFPVTVRAGVDAGELTWARGGRAALAGRVESSWSLGAAGFEHNVTVPVGAVAQVMLPGASAAELTEAGAPLSAAGSVVTVIGSEDVNGIPYVSLRVLSGGYRFGSSWTRPASRAVV